MKKILSVFVLYLSVTTTTLADNVHQLRKHGVIQSIDNGALQIIDEIIRVLGLKTNFEVKPANIPNAVQ